MTKPSYTSNSIAPTESAAEWYDRVTERGVTIDTASLRKWADAGDEGAREALYDEHLARRAEEVPPSTSPSSVTTHTGGTPSSTTATPTTSSN
jgi:hypothetical protein